MDKKFTINKRFLVEEPLNIVKDLENNLEHRLEPRLMSVLCMLAGHEGELVTRVQLITEIWNDYGGAEDSLNQAISYLRKTLQDTNKEIIETIPKKGYILHASINYSQKSEKGVGAKTKLNFKHFAVAALVILAFIFVAGLMLNRKAQDYKNDSSVKTIVPKNMTDSVEVNFSELNKPEEENSSNTITTTAPDGTKYRLVANGDKRPMLYVNGKLISGTELEKYSKIEGQLLRLLWDRQSKHMDTIRSGKSK